MHRTRRTLVDIETHEITVIRAGLDPPISYCEICEANVLAFVPERLGQLLRQDPDELRREVANEQMHFTTRQRSQDLICGKSASRSQRVQTITTRRQK